jgi:hypothetical protein
MSGVAVASPPAKNAATGANESSSAVRKARQALNPVGTIKQPKFEPEPTEAQQMQQKIVGQAGQAGKVGQARRRRRTRRTRRRVRGGEYSAALERTLRSINVNQRNGAQDSASEIQTALLGLKKTRGAKRRSLSTRGASRGTRRY